jgi:hypothetical protein
MHLVQAFIFFTTPLTTAFTTCRFGLKRLLVTLWAWLMLQPYIGFLPQTSHSIAIANSPDKYINPSFLKGGSLYVSR